MAADLAKNRFVGRLIMNPLWQALLRWGFMAALIGLIFTAVGLEKLPGVADPYPLLYTNAATLLFWVLWFMGIVLLSPLLGRAWCSVCPLGFMSDRIGRIGLNLPWPAKWARNLGPLAVFGAGVAAALLLDAHKSPNLTAFTVGLAALLAVASALLWRRAAFCGFFCPVGTVLSLYGRFSPIKVGMRVEGACQKCAEHGCVARTSTWRRWDFGTLVIHKKVYTSGCPVALDPPTMDASECLLCMECVRRCPSSNLGVHFGRRTSMKPLHGAPLFLLAPLAGLVILVLIRTWPELRDALAPGVYPPVWVWAAWFGLLIPALFLFAPALLELLGVNLSSVPSEEPEGADPGRPAKVKKQGFAWAAARYAAPFAGPVLGAHMAVALVKLNAKAAYVPYLFYDPFGATTYMAIHVTGALGLPPMLLAMCVLRIAAPALLALGIFLGMWDAARLWKKPLGAVPRAGAWLCFGALSTLYGATLVHWLLAGK